ncbi:MAG: molybdate ABC transporter substrate-binding protein [Acidimicrobiia bacterium]
MRRSASVASMSAAAVAVVALLVAAFVVPAGAAKTATKPSGTITVSAAASLTEAFTQMGTDFQKANPGTTVTFNFGPSSGLVTQIQGGAPADVFASADGANMIKLVNGGQVTAEPTVFAMNELVIVTKPGNPTKIKGLADLAKVDVLSLCADTVPCGKYAQQAFTQSGIAIDQSKVTKGADVKATLAAVTTGDADAAVVYASDAKAAGNAVTTVRIPAWLNIYAVYPIAPLASTGNKPLAKAWVDYTVSPAGQKTLRTFGFLAPPGV